MDILERRATTSFSILKIFLIRQKYFHAFFVDDWNRLNPNTFLNLRKRIWFPFLQSTNHVSDLFSSTDIFFSEFTSNLKKMWINFHAFYPSKIFISFMINYWKLYKNWIGNISKFYWLLVSWHVFFIFSLRISMLYFVIFSVAISKLIRIKMLWSLSSFGHKIGHCINTIGKNFC